MAGDESMRQFVRGFHADQGERIPGYTFPVQKTHKGSGERFPLPQCQHDADRAQQQHKPAHGAATEKANPMQMARQKRIGANQRDADKQVPVQQPLIPPGSAARALFSLHKAKGNGSLDFSSLLKLYQDS